MNPGCRVTKIGFFCALLSLTGLRARARHQPPTGTYTITVTATSGALIQTMRLTLTVQ